jgi:hypothetical protein
MRVLYSWLTREWKELQGKATVPAGARTENKVPAGAVP